MGNEILRASDKNTIYRNHRDRLKKSHHALDEPFSASVSIATILGETEISLYRLTL